MFRNTLRFTLGAVAGALLWWFATPAYNVFLSSSAAVVLRADGRFDGAMIAAAGRSIVATGPKLPSIRIPADQLTFNLVLFSGLFATSRRLFRDRNLLRLLVAIAVLVITHALGVAANLEAAYATRLGDWSNTNYSPLAQDVWTAVAYIYRMGGMFAIAFACWWVAGEAAAREAKP